jgi:hypothetical protein
MKLNLYFNGTSFKEIGSPTKLLNITISYFFLLYKILFKNSNKI